MSADHELDAIARADQASPIEARKILVAEIERLRAALDKAHRLMSQMVGWQRDAEIEKAKLQAGIAELRKENDMMRSLIIDAPTKEERDILFERRFKSEGGRQ